MIRQTVKRFCREEIAPYAEEWDHAGIFPKELFKKAADLGLFGIRIDPEWGGRAWTGGPLPHSWNPWRMPIAAASAWR